MPRRRRQIQGEVAFQLAPMIDVTFLLIVFFMITSKASSDQKQRTISLPTVTIADAPGEKSEREIINIDAEGRYWVGQSVYSPGELKALLKERFAARPPLKVYVRADRQTPAKKIKEVIGVVGEAGGINISFGYLRE